MITPYTHSPKLTAARPLSVSSTVLRKGQIGAAWIPEVVWENRQFETPHPRAEQACEYFAGEN